MEPDRPSLTARRVAMRRAAHQILDEPKIFDDPVALKIIGTEAAAEIRAEPEKYQTVVGRYLRAFLVARSRFAEEQLEAAVARGVCQYVILGAGLDTFAYRNPYAALRVFEVDHPATQAWKRQQLGEAGIAEPSSLVFVPVDFQRQALADELSRVGFRPDEPAFFSWLGVTMYLTRDAVMTTFKYVASATPRGSGIVFDYAMPPSSLGPLKELAFQVLAQRVAAIGEPWQTFFDPPALAAELREMGFAAVQDLGADELNQRYFQNRADGLCVGGIGHLLSASR